MKNLKILIRFDDICPTMNWELFNKAICMLDDMGITALLGVIPDCQDPDLYIDEPNKEFWSILKRLQDRGYSIAMHGYQHVFDINKRGIVNKGNKSEFAGHPYEIQYEKIRKGKELLVSHGIFTDTFFAPAHSYDNVTLKALSANGFKYISDGKSIKPYEKNGIKCIPCRSGGISSMRFGTYHVAVLHTHEWALPQKQHDFKKFDDLLCKHHYSIVNFDEFKSMESGWLPWQKVTEHANILLERYMKRLLSKLVRIKRG